MFNESALYSRIQLLLKLNLSAALVTQNHTSSWSTKSLVSRCRCHMSIWNQAWMQSCCNKTCNIGHIYPSDMRLSPVCNLTEFFKINCSRVIALAPATINFGLSSQKASLYIIIIDHASTIDTIGHNIHNIFPEILTGEPLCQMSINDPDSFPLLYLGSSI